MIPPKSVPQLTTHTGPGAVPGGIAACRALPDGAYHLSTKEAHVQILYIMYWLFPRDCDWCPVDLLLPRKRNYRRYYRGPVENRNHSTVRDTEQQGRFLYGRNIPHARVTEGRACMGAPVFAHRPDCR